MGKIDCEVRSSAEGVLKGHRGTSTACAGTGRANRAAVVDRLGRAGSLTQSTTVNSPPQSTKKTNNLYNRTGNRTHRAHRPLYTHVLELELERGLRRLTCTSVLSPSSTSSSPSPSPLMLRFRPCHVREAQAHLQHRARACATAAVVLP